jgi:AmiR/NasT family two-component response regulator
MDSRARLEAMGYEVVETVSSGEEAMSAARMLRPDVVLMDIVIQGEMDGIEAAARVRSELGTPVVFMTAYSDQRTIKRAMEADPFGYINKPFDERDVRMAIDIAVLRHRYEERLRLGPGARAEMIPLNP